MGKKSELRKENEELRQQVERFRQQRDYWEDLYRRKAKETDELDSQNVDLHARNAELLRRAQNAERNLDLLEKQTELVAGLLGRGGIRPCLCNDFEDYWDQELEALSGIVSMLEAWTADREE